MSRGSFAEDQAAEYRAEQIAEWRSEDDAWRKWSMDELEPGDRLACPTCYAYELAVTIPTHYDLEVIIGPDGTPDPVQDANECGDDGIKVVTCQGCGATWGSVAEAVTALVLRPPDARPPR
jgi:hypothetical protein